jgi:hypothetical protein
MAILTSFAQVFSEYSPIAVRRDPSVDIRKSVSPQSMEDLVEHARGNQTWRAMFEQTLNSQEYQCIIDHVIERAFQVGYIKSQLGFEHDRSRLGYAGNLSQAQEEALRDRLAVLEDNLDIFKKYLPESHDNDLSDRINAAQRVGWTQYRLNLETVAESQGREGYLTVSQEFDFRADVNSGLPEAVRNVLVDNPYLENYPRPPVLPSNLFSSGAGTTGS